jgi:hypothetical protein
MSNSRTEKVRERSDQLGIKFPANREKYREFHSFRPCPPKNIANSIPSYSKSGCIRDFARPPHQAIMRNSTATLLTSTPFVQAWCLCNEGYLLRDQWRARAKYSSLRQAAKTFIKRYRPSAVLVEKAGAPARFGCPMMPNGGTSISARLSSLRPPSTAIRSTRRLNSSSLFPLLQL